METVIFDIHGTIADINHRLHFISGDKKDWAKFHVECINDKPIKSTISLLQSLHSTGHEIIFLTAGPEISRDLERLWIEKHIPKIFNDYQLLMRKSRDYRPDDIVKLEILEREGLTPDKVLFIVDDRNRVVKALRNKGYKVLQPQEGDY